jgi:AcrR family transcriptional regulator
MMSQDGYHHGNLHSEVLAHAAILISENGPDALSLRELARRAGVSHAAPAHHFGDRRGVFTALASEGFSLLSGELGGAGDDFKEAAVAYVRFAVTHPAHYAVMFRRDLVHEADPALVEARTRSGAMLAAGLRTLSPNQLRSAPDVAGLAAWSLVHGFALLWLDRALPADTAQQGFEQLTQAMAGQLFG